MAKNNAKIYRCKVCGYIHKGDEPAECPICQQTKCFEEIPENKVNYEFFKDAWSRQVKWMNTTKYQNEIELNPDEEVLKMIAESEMKSLLSGKQPYCPCRIQTGNVMADQKIVCPCYFYMGEVELLGHCHCSLYLDKNKKKNGK